ADEEVWREDYERMLADVTASRWKGIVVWRMDRLTRLPTEFARIVKVLQKSGAYLYSVQDELDSRNDRQLSAMWDAVVSGEREIKGIKKRITANKRGRAKAGKYSGGGRR